MLMSEMWIELTAYQVLLPISVEELVREVDEVDVEEEAVLVEDEELEVVVVVVVVVCLTAR